ncbi:MAG: carboxypeptidase regulatory-like domain-containing protein [Planctomycetota bacterium]|nr:MAG: carboxypeptidase regulatory-like domain-containing protein [Planctomycetota bacterium]
MNRSAWILLLLLVLAGLGWLLLGLGPAPADRGGEPSAASGAGGPETAGGVGALRPRQAAEAATVPDGAERTNLADGSTAGTALPPESERSGSVEFRVVDARRNPVRDVSVTLRTGSGPWPGLPGLGDLGLPDLEDEPEEPPPTASPDRDGRVRLSRLPAGEDLVLEVRGDSWVRRDLRVAPLRPGEDRRLGEIVLSPGVVLAGLVRDPAGAPFAGAEVSLRPDGDRFGFAAGGGGLRAEAESGSDGRFRLTGLAPGRYRLGAAAPGLVAAERVVEVAAEPREQTVDLRLGRGGTVTGRVLDPQAQPLAGARVLLAPMDGFAALRWQRRQVEQEGLEVGPDGRFRLEGLPPSGRWRVLAAADGFDLGRSGAVADGTDLELVLRPLRTLSGRVLDAEGRPVARASLRLEPLATGPGPMRFLGGARTVADEDGGFEFRRVAAGDYALVAEAPAGSARIEPLTLGDRNEPVEVRLSGGDALVVAVRDAAGRPVVGAKVRARSAAAADAFPAPAGAGRIRFRRGPGSGRTGNTDPAGEIRFLGLEPGPWSLRVSADGFADRDLEVQVRGEGEQREEVVLLPASSLVVRVVDTTGAPVAGAGLELRATEPDRSLRSSVRADDWGVAVWRGLEPGSYALFPNSGPQVFQFEEGGNSIGISWSGDEPAAAEAPALTLEIEPGEAAEEELVLASKAVLRVRVTRFGEPVAGATVALAPDQGDAGLFALDSIGGSRATTDGDGWASLPPVEAGRYQLSARAAPQSPPTREEVQLVPGPQERRLALATGEVSGRVVAPDGPLAGAVVHLVPGSPQGEHRGTVMMSVAVGDDGGAEPAVETISFAPGQSTVNTDADGAFRFRDVPAGEWHVVAKADGFGKTEGEPFTLAEGARIDLGLIEVEAAGSLRGKVLGLPEPDPDSPFALHLLQLQTENGEMVQMTVVRSDGSYAFGDVRPGTYRLSLERPGRGGDEPRVSKPIEVRAGPATVFDFRL